MTKLSELSPFEPHPNGKLCAHESEYFYRPRCCQMVGERDARQVVWHAFFEHQRLKIKWGRASHAIIATRRPKSVEANKTGNRRPGLGGGREPVGYRVREAIESKNASALHQIVPALDADGNSCCLVRTEKAGTSLVADTLPGRQLVGLEPVVGASPGEFQRTCIKRRAYGPPFSSEQVSHPSSWPWRRNRHAPC